MVAGAEPRMQACGRCSAERGGMPSLVSAWPQSAQSHVHAVHAVLPAGVVVLSTVVMAAWYLTRKRRCVPHMLRARPMHACMHRHPLPQGLERGACASCLPGHIAATGQHSVCAIMRSDNPCPKHPSRLSAMRAAHEAHARMHDPSAPCGAWSERIMRRPLSMHGAGCQRRCQPSRPRRGAGRGARRLPPPRRAWTSTR